MRVVLAPSVDPASDALSSRVATALAGAGGEVVALRAMGLRPFRPQLTQAEVDLVREALLGRGLADLPPTGERAETVVGYVCRGTAALERAAAVGAGREERCGRVVAVSDHAGLTWRSPLTGPNDDRLGPRFPRVDRVYVPEAVVERVGGCPGVTITSAIVAGVGEESRPTPWEVETAATMGFAAFSAELVPVAISAAHLGLRLAAAVVVEDRG